MDPDNGLECGTKLGNLRAGKYAYIHEIQQLIDRKQSVILYQHLDRSALAETQIARRAQHLIEASPSSVSIQALRNHARVYYVMLQPRHSGFLARGIETATHGTMGAALQVGDVLARRGRR
jgi:hypothetical protein